MKRILVVEDDKATQDIYARKLRELGYEVEIAADGKVALSSANRNKPDLILMDLMLPGGMNGFDILNRLKNDPETEKVKVIVLTNLSSEAETAKDMKVDDYLVKSNTSIQEVVDTIQKHLGEPPAKA